jgi:hypothetical protein
VRTAQQGQQDDGHGFKAEEYETKHRDYRCITQDGRRAYLKLINGATTLVIEPREPERMACGCRQGDPLCAVFNVAGRCIGSQVSS